MSNRPHYFKLLKKELGLNDLLCAAALGLSSNQSILRNFMSAMINGDVGTAANLIAGAAMLFGQSESDGLDYHREWLESRGASGYIRHRPYSLQDRNIYIQSYRNRMIIPGAGGFSGSITRSMWVGVITYTGADKGALGGNIDTTDAVTEAQLFLEGK